MNQDAVKYSIQILSKQDYSILKIEQKLVSRKYTSEEIKETIDYLISKKYLNEDEYKRGKIRNLLQKSFSNYYITQKLSYEHLSVDESEIDDLRVEYDINFDAQIHQLIQNKLKKTIIPTDHILKQKLKNKILSHLNSKGYTFEEIEYIFLGYFNE